MPQHDCSPPRPGAPRLHTPGPTGPGRPARPGGRPPLLSGAAGAVRAGLGSDRGWGAGPDCPFLGGSAFFGTASFDTGPSPAPWPEPSGRAFGPGPSLRAGTPAGGAAGPASVRPWPARPAPRPAKPPSPSPAPPRPTPPPRRPPPPARRRRPRHPARPAPGWAGPGRAGNHHRVGLPGQVPAPLAGGGAPGLPGQAGAAGGGGAPQGGAGAGRAPKAPAGWKGFCGWSNGGHSVVKR
jgi:hypothetical protein